MNQDLTSQKIEEIRSMTGLNSTLPVIPVAIAVQEALNLYGWCQDDREIICRTGLDWKIVEDLPIRAGALSSLEISWTSEHGKVKDCQKEWKIALPLALDLRKKLLHHFYYSFRSNHDAYTKARRISDGRGHADMIQDLIDLSALGKKYKSELEAINMDFSLLDTAWQMSFDLGDLLARASNARKDWSENQELRNKAFYHLKEAVESVRKAGKYAFSQDKDRYKGYISPFLQRKYQKSKPKTNKPGK